MARRRVRARRADESHRRLRELEAIARVAADFTFDQPLEAMMDDVARQVVVASGAALACIIGQADRTTRLVSHILGGHNLPPGFRETLEYAWRTGGTPLVSSSLTTQRHQFVDLATVLQRPGYEGVRDAQRLAGWSTMVVMPMVYRSEAVGLVIVPYPDAYTPDAPEISFLTSIADQAAVAIENARLFEGAQAAAVDEERQRMSRELHDSVSQALYGISLGAQTARELLDTDPTAAIEPVDYIITLANAGLAEMRAMIFDLRPEALEAEGIVAALRRQATSIQARQGIAVDASLGEEPELPLAKKQALYRVAQEALHNVVKHARASAVSITLSQDEHGLTLTIRDNGRGFAVVDHYPGHLGVTSMRERVRREGGAITIESEPGSGCRIRVELPVARRPTAE